MWAKVDLNPEQLVLLIAQLEPGNTSTEITLPDSTMELYLGYSPESITDALYKAALIVKRQSDAAIKKQAKAKAQAAASAEAALKSS
jgi:hypothetical protein